MSFTPVFIGFVEWHWSESGFNFCCFFFFFLPGLWLKGRAFWDHAEEPDLVLKYVLFTALHIAFVTYSHFFPWQEQRKEKSYTDSQWYLYFHHINIIVTCRECLRIRLHWKHSRGLLPHTVGIQIVVQLYKHKTKEAGAIGALISK